MFAMSYKGSDYHDCSHVLTKTYEF